MEVRRASISRVAARGTGSSRFAAALTCRTISGIVVDAAGFLRNARTAAAALAGRAATVSAAIPGAAGVPTALAGRTARAVAAGLPTRAADPVATLLRIGTPCSRIAIGGLVGVHALAANAVPRLTGLIIGTVAGATALRADTSAGAAALPIGTGMGLITDWAAFRTESAATVVRCTIGHLGAAHYGAGRIHTREVGAREISIDEAGIREVGTSQRGIREIRTAQVCAREIALAAILAAAHGRMRKVTLADVPFLLGNAVSSTPAVLDLSPGFLLVLGLALLRGIVTIWLVLLPRGIAPWEKSIRCDQRGKSRSTRSSGAQGAS